MRIEAVTHHAGDAPDSLMDDGIAAIFEAVEDRGPGPHVLTGPIAVAGARPGGLLEVRILSAEPRRLPARTCVAVSGLALGALVEIDLLAAHP